MGQSEIFEIELVFGYYSWDLYMSDQHLKHFSFAINHLDNQYNVATIVSI